MGIPISPYVLGQMGTCLQQMRTSWNLFIAQIWTLPLQTMCGRFAQGLSHIQLLYPDFVGFVDIILEQLALRVYNTLRMEVSRGQMQLGFQVVLTMPILEYVTFV